MKRKKVQPLRKCNKKATPNLQLQDEDNRDRLGSLPDPLLVSILSLLPVKTATKTSILSRRWRYLWTQITNLDLSNFYCRSDGDEVSPFISSIDHIFDQLISNKIHSLHLKFPFLRCDANRVVQLQSCQFALERWLGRFCYLNVEEIKVISRGYPAEDRLLNLPKCIFNCRSLAMLDIHCGFRFQLHGMISLPNLNKIVLRYLADWDSETMSTLFKSCPVLEVLDIEIGYEKLRKEIIDISCQNLRTLKIEVKYVQKGWNYIIKAPKLVVLDVEGNVSSFRFVENPCLLSSAKIKLSKSSEDVAVDYIETMTVLVQGISSVESLVLSSLPLSPLVQLDGLSVPSFRNLLELRIYLNDTSGRENVLGCLHGAPNLKVLFIDKAFRQKGVKWDVPNCVPLCLSQKICRIEVMHLKGSEEELKFLQYILGNANVLKSILVGVSSHTTLQLGKEVRFCKNLFWSPKGSRACVINFQGYLRASSTNNQPYETLKCEILI